MTADKAIKEMKEVGDFFPFLNVISNRPSTWDILCKYDAFTEYASKTENGASILWRFPDGSAISGHFKLGYTPEYKLSDGYADGDIVYS